MLIQQILVGAIMIAIGCLTLKFNFQLGNMVRLQWVEGKIGSGTTFMVYKILSVLLVLIGVIYIAGFGDNLINWALSPLDKIFNPN